MKVKKKIFLVDAYAIIYRAYFAFIKNPRINSKGYDTSTVFGFANSIFEIINNKNIPENDQNRYEKVAQYA